MIITAIPVVSLLLFTAPLFAQKTAGAPSAENSSRVMAAVAAAISAEHLGAVATFVALATTCDSVVEYNLCSGRTYKRSVEQRVRQAATDMAQALAVPVTADWESRARDLITSPVIDSSKSRTQWYQTCTPKQRGETLPIVLTVRPSAIREVTSGNEWRVVAIVNADPVRGECVGAGTKSEFTITRAPNSNQFVVSSVQLLGSGHGHLR